VSTDESQGEMGGFERCGSRDLMIYETVRRVEGHSSTMNVSTACMLHTGYCNLIYLFSAGAIPTLFGGGVQERETSGGEREASCVPSAPRNQP
jgi:hypothetical protein